ncbi:hypothetical protein B0H12DRAFT_1232052 [Mycena haematopus]|nr:hypothetical protein B0H12DRAFT_1232052 [Mycena haematopus]
MDDISFCAVCDIQIVPKRTLVPVYAVPEPSPDAARQRRQGSLRRAGLVHGTGRVRPNGTIKAATPVKTRLEIDQSPAPLYCSDACRQRDIHGDPSDTDDDAAPLRTARARPAPAPRSTPNTRSLAVLQREYNMQPLPPPTCATYDECAPPRAPRAEYTPPAFTSGIMMASRRIDAILPKPLRPGETPPPLKPIPGWTDGSQAWRASTYSFAPPPRTRADVLDPNRAAYTSFDASPHRSAHSGVTASSLSSSSSSASSSQSPHSPASSISELLSSFEDSIARRASSRLSLVQSDSPSPSCSASPPRRSRQLAASQLLVPDVLLRPNPPKHTKFSSASSSRSSSELSAQQQQQLSAQQQRTARRHSSGSFSAQRRMRSPLSNEGSVVSGSSASDDADVEEEDETAEPTPAAPARPTVESEFPLALPYLPLSSRFRRETNQRLAARSWSYDNVRTYPVMVLKETRVVDGVEVEVEVQPEKRKRLFTFAPIPVGAGAHSGAGTRVY